MAYKIREKKPGYLVEIILVVIGCMGGTVNRLREQIVRMLETDEKKMARTWRKMLMTILAENESLIKKSAVKHHYRNLK